MRSVSGCHRPLRLLRAQSLRYVHHLHRPPPPSLPTPSLPPSLPAPRPFNLLSPDHPPRPLTILLPHCHVLRPLSPRRHRSFISLPLFSSRNLFASGLPNLSSNLHHSLSSHFQFLLLSLPFAFHLSSLTSVLSNSQPHPSPFPFFPTHSH